MVYERTYATIFDVTEVIHPDDDDLAHELAERVEAAAKQILADQRAIRLGLAENARIAQERDGSYEVQLATQTTSLLARMTWLVSHPFLSLFSKHALGVHRDINRRGGIRGISTNTLTDGVIAKFSGELLLYSGLVFSNRFSDEGDTLSIHQEVKDHSSKAEGSELLYSIRPYSTEIGARVVLFSQVPSVSEGDGVHRREKLEEHLQEHEYLEPYGFDRIDCNRSVPSFPSPPLSLVEPEWVRGMAERKIEPLLWPAQGFRYPDEMYLGPLTFVRQMNMLLGTKTDKK